MRLPFAAYLSPNWSASVRLTVFGLHTTYSRSAPKRTGVIHLDAPSATRHDTVIRASPVHYVLVQCTLVPLDAVRVLVDDVLERVRHARG
ncbi:MAG: hypothetical protein WKH64_05430 [Chloroflexia bacterium]